MNILNNHFIKQFHLHAKMLMRYSALILGFMMCSTIHANAQNAIESVTGSTQSGVEVIKIGFSQAISTLPTGFAIQSPARIVLDFPNVASGVTPQLFP